MKNLFAILISLLFVKAYSQLTVATKKMPSPYKKHGMTIADDYAWLEDLQSPETVQWVEEENRLTNAHLEEIKKKYDLQKKIIEFDSHESNNLPRKKGKYFYSLYFTDRNKPPSLYYSRKIDERPTLLLNPTEVFEGNDFVLGDFYPSKSSGLLAYLVNKDGSDRAEIRFMDINKKQKLEDVITDVKFSEARWNLDLGVFYRRNSNINKIAADSTYQLFYHKMGTKQQDDRLIFDNSKTTSLYRFFTTRGKLLIIDENRDTNISSFYQASLAGDDFIVTKFFEDKTGSIKFQDYRNGQVYYSSKDFEWGEIRSFSIDNPQEEKIIVPQIYSQLLVSSYFTEDYIFCRYKSLGKNYIRVYDPAGNFIRKFDTPDGFGFKIKYYDEELKSLYVTLESYTTPSVNYRLNVETGEFAPYYNTFIRAKSSIFPMDYFDTKCITYKSRDNKDVPITIVCKKGTKMDGTNPTLLKAYGGFGIVSSPNFSPGLLSFLDAGGVFAYAEIRGGGEKGLKWAKEGRNLKKMNSFNDFIDAAEYLIREKYTSPSKLAINGGSYGGLVVGVAMTKRPDLFKVAIPEMGALDMMKFEQYTIGNHHFSEFGNTANKEEFDNLLSYSPYHNIDDKTDYPVTLIITSENDDRVPPLHSFKFAARLQNRENQKNPIYLETFDKSGHYGKISTYEKYMKSEADFYGFLLYHLNN